MFLSAVRLLGVRMTSAALGFGLLAAGLGVLGAGSSGPAAIRYELNASLLATGGRVFACFSDALMGPAAGCGGIEVKGVDLSQVPDGGGDHGSPWSQTMRLVGTWDGQALTLTESPQPAQKGPGLAQPCAADATSEPGPDPIRLQIQVIDALATRGIHVLMSMGCGGDTVGVVVPVADEATVSWLTSLYHARVVGWLQPLPSGP